MRGTAFARAYTDLVDDWLAALLPPGGGLAIVAVGGYGHRTLAPASDLDVLLLHDPARRDVADAAEQLWYPVWDAGLRLDHSVRTVGQAVRTAGSELKVALGLLDARLVAGDERLFAGLHAAIVSGWRRRAPRFVPQLIQGVRDRHDQHDSVAFVLEPDLKEGGGGLRDVTAVRAVRSMLAEWPAPELDAAAQALVEARVELQRCTGRPENRLLLEHQDEVADALAMADADELMRDVAAAARTVSWHFDAVVRHARRPRGRRGASRPARDEPGALVRRRGGELELTARASPTDDPGLVVHVAARAATEQVPISRETLLRLAAEAPAAVGTWTDAARTDLVLLLGAGPATVDVFESLDQHDLVTRVLPEWEAVRSRPQRNAFHRYTVDRHLVEAARQAAARRDRVERPDLLLIGAWLHDLGKGFPGDHTDAGIVLMRTLASRLGYGPDDVETLVGLVRHHLLLPAVATSRDLDDPATIAGVASVVGDRAFLDLLATLTEADSVATGPTAWNPWKRDLVASLVVRVAGALAGVPHVPSSATPDADQALVARAADGLRVEGGDQHLAVAALDRPRLFSHVVGLLALGGHDVRAARARSLREYAISEFELEPAAARPPDWARFRDQLVAAGRGDLDLDEALRERAEAYGRLRRPQTARVAPVRVTVDNDATGAATVVEVHAADEVGVLYRIARTLADLALDIRHAKVSTLGPEVIDTFYVLDDRAAKLTAPDAVAALRGRLLDALRPEPAWTAVA